MSRILRRLAEVDEERKSLLRIVPTPTSSEEAYETGIVRGAPRTSGNPSPSTSPPPQVPSPKR